MAEMRNKPAYHLDLVLAGRPGSVHNGSSERSISEGNEHEEAKS